MAARKMALVWSRACRLWQWMWKCPLMALRDSVFNSASVDGASKANLIEMSINL
jgi:hypothetical protein